jgi:hypothetical protein
VGEEGWGGLVRPIFYMTAEGLDLEERKGKEKAPFLTIGFLLIHLFAYVLKQLPRNARSNRLDSAFQELYYSYSYYYKTAKYKKPKLADWLGNYRFGIIGQVIKKENKEDGFNWNRLADLFKGYRS